MNSNLLLLKYNNYFDRKLKIENSLNDYLSYDYYIDWARNTKGDIAVVNFNPNDGINTQQIIQLNENLEEPNYCLVIQDNQIISRWFITELARTKIGQYQMNLRRDVLADFWNKGLQDAPVFCHRGMVTDSNPLVVNPEEIKVNQIKKNSIRILDYSSHQWLVAYYKVETDTSCSKEDPYVSRQTYSSWTDYPYNAYRNKKTTIDITSYIVRTKTHKHSGNRIVNKTVSWNDKGYWMKNPSGSTTQGLEINNPNGFGKNLSEQESTNHYVLSYLETLNQKASSSLIDELRKEEQIVRVNGKYYQIKIEEGTEYLPDITPISGSELRTTLNSMYQEASPSVVLGGTPEVVESKRTYIQMTSTEISEPQAVNLTLKSSNKTAYDAPYCMLAMPYNDMIVVTGPGPNDYYWQRSRTSMLAMQSIAETGVAYDIQIVPYCPILDRIGLISGGSKYIDMENLTGYNVDIDYINIKDGSNNTIGVGWLCRSTQFETVSELASPLTTSNLTYGYKEDSIINMYRLVSPNYNGTFEFKKSFNGGTIKKFKITCAYKPYNPYIHVSPDFDGLYGIDFKDARGLVCSGNFSIATLTDQWKQYEINNKNYQNQFNLEIDTMDQKHTMSQIQSIIGKTSSAISSGVGMGLKTGNAAAGVASGVLSAAGGIADYAMEEKNYELDMNLKRTSFQFNCENVQARPNVLTKVDSLNPNNAYTVILEYYTCTPEEKEYVENFIKYRGMTINAIGTINDFTQYDDSWFVGELIYTVDDLGNCDSHMINVINEELLKGVYV